MRSGAVRQRIRHAADIGDLERVPPEEQGEHGRAACLGELGGVEGADMREARLPVEPAFERQAVEARAEPDEVPPADAWAMRAALEGSRIIR